MCAMPKNAEETKMMDERHAEKRECIKKNHEPDNEADEEEDDDGLCAACRRSDPPLDTDNTLILCLDCDRNFYFNCHVPMYGPSKLECSNVLSASTSKVSTIMK